MLVDCIFCKIISGQLPSAMLYADEHISAFRDIQPQAKVHVLIVPNRHLVSLNDVEEQDGTLLGKMLQVAVQIARDEGIAETGYRVVTNSGRDAQQSVDHLHFHVLGGNPLYPRLG
ncbi:MAG TPA: histidine triad nucleotide-binding protein [Nitrolancea sp.]|nr:histidine triad nucleotide-binding protein [Nitrolancea sp.]